MDYNFGMMKQARYGLTRVLYPLTRADNPRSDYLAEATTEFLGNQDDESPEGGVQGAFSSAFSQDFNV